MKKSVILLWLGFLSVSLSGQILPSGCYYVKEKNDSTVLATGPQDTVWIDPNPIITAEDFHSVKLVKNKCGDAVDVNLTRSGADKFRKATAGWVTRKMAIVVHGEVISAPTVVSEITGGKVWITGSKNQDMRIIEQKLEAEIKRLKR
jgi:preprotein translocase subunit SecD